MTGDTETRLREIGTRLKALLPPTRQPSPWIPGTIEDAKWRAPWDIKWLLSLVRDLQAQVKHLEGEIGGVAMAIADGFNDEPGRLGETESACDVAQRLLRELQAARAVVEAAETFVVHGSGWVGDVSQALAAYHALRKGQEVTPTP